MLINIKPLSVREQVNSHVIFLKNGFSQLSKWSQVNTRLIVAVLSFSITVDVCLYLLLSAGQRQSSVAWEDQRRLHSPTVHHRRHEANADREHHRPRRKRDTHTLWNVTEYKFNTIYTLIPFLHVISKVNSLPSWWKVPHSPKEAGILS